MWFDCPHGLGPLHLIVDLFWLLMLAPLLYIKRFWWWIRGKKNDMSKMQINKDT